MNKEQVIKLIERLADRYGQKPSTVCYYAGCSGHLYDNLTSGGDCTLKTIIKLRAYKGVRV